MIKLASYVFCSLRSVTRIACRRKMYASRYCLIWVFPFGLPLKVFKMRLLGRGFHTLIKNVSFSSPTDVGSHNPPPFGAQRPRWYSFPSSIDVGPQSTPFGAQCPCWHTASCPPPSSLNLLAGTSPGAGSDTICNDPSSPLADIVFFGFSFLVFPSVF